MQCAYLFILFSGVIDSIVDALKEVNLLAIDNLINLLKSLTMVKTLLHVYINYSNSRPL